MSLQYRNLFKKYQNFHQKSLVYRFIENSKVQIENFIYGCFFRTNRKLVFQNVIIIYQFVKFPLIEFNFSEVSVASLNVSAESRWIGLIILQILGTLSSANSTFSAFLDRLRVETWLKKKRDASFTECFFTILQTLVHIVFQSFCVFVFLWFFLHDSRWENFRRATHEKYPRAIVVIYGVLISLVFPVIFASQLILLTILLNGTHVILNIVHYTKERFIRGMTVLENVSDLYEGKKRFALYEKLALYVLYMIPTTLCLILVFFTTSQEIICEKLQSPFLFGL